MKSKKKVVRIKTVSDLINHLQSFFNPTDRIWVVDTEHCEISNPVLWVEHGDNAGVVALNAQGYGCSKAIKIGEDIYSCGEKKEIKE